MDISRLDLNLLLTFEAISVERNVTRAATRLGLTQPAVSSALSRLRKITGDPLFVRTSVGMDPTPRAEQLFEPIEGALRLIRSGFEGNLPFEASSSNKKFTILVTDAGQVLYMPKLMAYASRNAPGITFQTRRLLVRSYGQLLESNEADIAVGSFKTPKESLFYRRLYFSSYVCLVSRKEYGDSIDRNTYLNSTHVVGLHGDRFQELFSAQYGPRIKLNTVANVSSPLAIPSIITGTTHIATIPSALAQEFVKWENLKILPFPFDIPIQEVGLFWHLRQQHDLANKWLRQCFYDLFFDEHARGETPLPVA